MEEAKRCPFCGNEPKTIVIDTGATKVWCSNEHCILGVGWVWLPIWNHRAIEDELTKENKGLTSEVESCHYIMANWMKVRNRIIGVPETDSTLSALAMDDVLNYISDLKAAIETEKKSAGIYQKLWQDMVDKYSFETKDRFTISEHALTLLADYKWSEETYARFVGEVRQLLARVKALEEEARLMAGANSRMIADLHEYETGYYKFTKISESYPTEVGFYLVLGNNAYWNFNRWDGESDRKVWDETGIVAWMKLPDPERVW